MNLFQKVFDERFLNRRRSSSSVAGIAVAVVALVVFEWRLLTEQKTGLNPQRLFFFGALFVRSRFSLAESPRRI